MSRDPLTWLESVRPPPGATDQPVVYTASFGGVDVIDEPAPQSVSTRFVCFVDDDRLRPGWETIRVPGLPLDARRTARLVKLFASELFPEHRVSIWVDANARILGDLGSLGAHVSEEMPFATLLHGERGDIFEEERICRLLAKDDPQVMREQVERYRGEGLSAGSGLFHTALLVRLHGSTDCINMMRAWWTEIQSGSVRDQLSLPYVVWKLGTSVATLPRSYAAPPMLIFKRHPVQVVYQSDGTPRIPLRHKPAWSWAYRARDRLLQLMGRL